MKCWPSNTFEWEITAAAIDTAGWLTDEPNGSWWRQTCVCRF